MTGDLITEPVGSAASAAFAASSPDRNSENVAVAYGRDTEAVNAMFSFLRDVGLRPLRWEQLRRETGTSTPYTGEIVEKAFEISQAVVVLFTPDDEARLHPDLRGKHEPETERELTGQPRQNVLIEAGMALSTHRRRTIIVEIGKLRPITNRRPQHRPHRLAQHRRLFERADVAFGDRAMPGRSQRWSRRLD